MAKVKDILRMPDFNAQAFYDKAADIAEISRWSTPEDTKALILAVLNAPLSLESLKTIDKELDNKTGFNISVPKIKAAIKKMEREEDERRR